MLSYRKHFGLWSAGASTDGTTDTQVISIHHDWKMGSLRAKEFLKLIHTIKELAPRTLTAEDISSVHGACYRGTSVFLALLSLYAFGSIYSIKDYSVFQTSNDIEKKSFLVAKEKEPALSYANKYISNGSAEAFVRYEKPIFERFLRENNLESVEFPLAMLQPILLAFDNEPFHDFHHKIFESELFNGRPNLTCFDLIASVCNLPNMASDFPLLYQAFEKGMLLERPKRQKLLC